MLLNRMIDTAALRQPDAEAIRCDAETLSYEQLARRSNGLARVLLEGGLRRGDRVAVLLGKGLAVPVSFYGVLAAGGTLVPVDPKSPVEQLVRILRATGATHLVSEPGKRAVIGKALAACPQVRQLVGLGPEDDCGPTSIPWTTVAAEATDRPPQVETIEMDPAYILHTSGSTGTPKLILHTHRSAMSFVDWAVTEYRIEHSDRLSNHSSHHTCFATFDYYAAARAGATTVILTPAAMMMPSSLAQLLERERLSIWYSVPTALVHLSLRGDLESRNLSSLRWVLFAGETFPEKHLRRIRRQLPGARFSHVYGSTEVNVCTYFHLPEDSLADGLDGALPIGKACGTARTLVVDDDLEPVPDGDVGELLVRGSTVMSGYWGDLEGTRRAFLRRPGSGGFDDVYFRTGDRVRMREDGNLTFVARSDFQVKVRGHRVELEGVESALLSLDPVEEAAAVAVEDSEGSHTLQAVVVTTDGEGASSETLQADLRRLLPPQSIPAEIAVVSALPRTPTGKVDRNELRREITRRGVSR